MSTPPVPPAMQAVVFDFEKDVFVRADVPTPTPGPGELLIRVLACGLNPVDAKMRLWKSMVGTPLPTHHVPGLDVCGVVAAVGEGVDAYAVGDRVLYHGKMLEAHGGYAEYAVHDALTTLPCPESKLGAAEAAAIPCAAWTAYKALHDKLRIEAEDVLLVYGASGGVGSFAVQYARLVGARVIAVCSGKNAAYVRDLGADSVIDYTNPEGGSVKAAVLALTDGRGVDKALDLVGEDTTATCADVLAFDGIVCPAVSNAQPGRTHDQFMRGVTFAQVTLGGAHGEGERARRKLRQLAQTATDIITDNNFTVPVTRTVGLDEVPAALDEMFHAHTSGKVVFVAE